MNDTNETLRKELGPEFAVETRGAGVRIRTPLVLPDGEVVDLQYQEVGPSQGIVTDLGETLRWLRTQATDESLARLDPARIGELAAALEVEFRRGELRLSVAGLHEIGKAVQRLLKAVQRVSELR